MDINHAYGHDKACDLHKHFLFGEKLNYIKISISSAAGK